MSLCSLEDNEDMVTAKQLARANKKLREANEELAKAQQELDELRKPKTRTRNLVAKARVPLHRKESRT